MSMTSAGVRRPSIPKRSISMKNDSFAAEGLATLLASCSPVNFQDIEEAVVAASQKRSRYSIFETSEETGDEYGADDYSYHVEKKKRLSLEQVKALEKNFELENKLEPERKLQLAQELRLQPRQVAVWFQNRRARWKTKQLEKDYDILKSDYEILRADFDALLNEKGKLENQVMELNEKLHQQDEKVSNVLDGKPGMDSFKRPEVSIKLEKDVETLIMTDISVLPFIGKMCPQSVCLTGLTDLEVKEGSSTSDSDSEILDVASPKLHSGGKNALVPELQHHISSEILVLGGLDVGLLQLGEDVIYERVFPQIYQLHAMKQEDVADKEENGHSFLTIEDQVGAFSCWDWS